MPFPVTELVERLEDVYGVPDPTPRYEPVEELVCCILTQHSTDAVAFPTFDLLRETLPTWDQVVEAGPERVAKIIRRTGLANQKARSIVGCLTAIEERTGSYSLDFLRAMPPQEARKWLMSLPGVGPKTASIVLSFSMGMDLLAVDTHVFRVSWRLGLIEKELGENRAHEALQTQLPSGLSFRYHMALIRHGRTICRAPLPLCERCAVTDLCRWYREHGL